MEMAFRRNEKVQAIDELGRWENAVVTEVLEDGYEVRFPGCERDCDRVVKAGEIRERVAPLEEQIRSKFTDLSCLDAACNVLYGYLLWLHLFFCACLSVFRGITGDIWRRSRREKPQGGRHIAYLGQQAWFEPLTPNELSAFSNRSTNWKCHPVNGMNMNIVLKICVRCISCTIVILRGIF